MVNEYIILVRYHLIVINGNHRPWQIDMIQAGHNGVIGKVLKTKFTQIITAACQFISIVLERSRMLSILGYTNLRQ